MDALATLLSDWAALVRVLVKKAELVPDDEARAATWRRIGEARRDMLDDALGAIEAYERALELEPESTLTLDDLIALYEQRSDAARLVDLYRRRVELCGEDDDGPQVPAPRRRGAPLRERSRRTGARRSSAWCKRSRCASKDGDVLRRSTRSTRTSGCGPSCSTT